jgi:hypothetical protein
LLSIIRPDCFNQFNQFGERFCKSKFNKFKKGLEFEGAENLKELNFVLKSNKIYFKIRNNDKKT